MITYPKRLIEVDLPIKRISEYARHETNVRHGHISTLHIWWARRPLAACRAVLCATLWPDPADPNCPQAFRKAALDQISKFAEKLLSDRNLHRTSSQFTFEHMNTLVKQAPTLDITNLGHLIQLRELLLDFIADFANWDNSTELVYLETARKLTSAAHLSLGGAPDTRPLIVDPFAGGGAIPLEALRVGADVFASDLNPVAVLLNKVILEYVPRYGQRLADELRKWGAWVKEVAEKELEHFYPKHDNATPMAYLWARTIICEGPNCGCEIPLLRSFWLAKKGVKSFAVRLIPKRVEKYVDFEIVLNPKGKEFDGGTVRSGAAICPCCGFITRASRVKSQLIKQGGGANFARLFAVYIEKDGIRSFVRPNDIDIQAYKNAQMTIQQMLDDGLITLPTEKINPIRPYSNTRGLSAVTRIGCETFKDLYSSRQLLGIICFYQIVKRVDKTLTDADPDFAKALRTLLTLAVSRAISQNTSVSRWDSSRSTIKGAFSKQALAVVWDFAEANPFSGGSADWDGAVEWIVKFINRNNVIDHTGQVIQASATQAILPSESVTALFTDPPYFAAIPYGDLSDFFYVWLAKNLGDLYPDLFASNLTEKSEELIVTNGQKTREGQTKDEFFFREKMTLALSTARDAVVAHGIGVVVYAEATTTGWEAILAALVDAGWIVTASWPIDTEMENRTRAQGAASLQSSIHIVCRPRESSDGTFISQVGDWRDVLEELPNRIQEWLPRLEQEGVVGADAIFSCIGPAMEIFSRYARVEKASGTEVTLREYLEQVWAAVSREALTTIFRGVDTTGFEEDARLTAMWLWTLNSSSVEIDNSNDESDDEELENEEAKNVIAGTLTGFALEYDAARKIAQGIGANLEKLGSLVQVKGSNARLLTISQRAIYLFGEDAGKVPTTPKKAKKQLSLFELLDEADAQEWRFDERESEYNAGKTTLDRLHQAMILHGTGRAEVLRRFLVEEGHGKDARFWRLADALLRLYPKSTDEYRWLDGLLARKKGLGL